MLVGLAGVRTTSSASLQTELALATLDRYGQAINAVTPAVEAAGHAGELPADGLPSREIRFDGVAFSYPDGPEVFGNLDLVVPAGRSLAIVGANGVGKTTLVKLLCRLYEPTAGRIVVDGCDLTTIDPVAWRNDAGSCTNVGSFRRKNPIALSASWKYVERARTKATFLPRTVPRA